MGSNRNEAQFERYRNWQWIKHLVFGDYTTPWAAKLGSISKEIYIVDVCAGAGSYKDERTSKTFDGSPVIFAERAKEYVERNPGRKMQVICVERNRKNFAALQRRVAGFSDLVVAKQGDFARHTDFICGTLGNSPALVVIDPIGLKSIPREACSPLVHRAGKTDVFAILHFKVVHRTGGQLLPTAYANPAIKGAERAAATIDASLGSPRWRWICLDPDLDVEEKERRFLDLYGEHVLGDRYDWKCAYPVRSRFDSGVQYWLVHASNHLDAFLLMNDEIVKLGKHLHFLTYDDPNALEGFAEQEYKGRMKTTLVELEKRVVEFVSGEPGAITTFGRMRDELMKEFFGFVKQGAYSNAVKSLVKQDRLVREERAAAKLLPTERISLPPTPVGVPVVAAEAA